MNNENELTHDFESARRGAVIGAKGKTRVTMYLDDDVLEHFRKIATENGRGYQTEINACLRQFSTRNETHIVRNIANDGAYVSVTKVSGSFNVSSISSRTGSFIVREKRKSLQAVVNVGFGSKNCRELQV